MMSRIRFISCASFVLAGLVLLPGCGGGDGGEEPALEFVVPRDTDAGAAQRPQVTLTIGDGTNSVATVVITLVPEHAPQTVANFLTYVNSGFYVGTIIHRHQAGFVLQGGGYVGPVTATDAPVHKATNAPIALELKVSNVLGTVAMARTNVLNSATSEFFINLANNTSLDLNGGGYAAFGYISNMTQVSAMTQAPCVSSTITQGTTFGCLPVPNLVITSAVQTR
jgi:cyclophilin family peptidyl-prolyl cis-trans isomerase